MIVGENSQSNETSKGEAFKKLLTVYAENSLGMPLTFARKRAGEPQWPIGLCIAWVLSPNIDLVTHKYAAHRALTELSPIDGWEEATNGLLRALRRGDITSTGIPAQIGVFDRSTPRIAIPHFEWADLVITQRGSYDDVRCKGGDIAYREVLIDATRIQAVWRAKKTLPVAAVTNAAAKRENERHCLESLVERMKLSPTEPIPKRDLRPDLPNVTYRAFDRLYSKAVEISGAVAWGLPGRRPARLK